MTASTPSTTADRRPSATPDGARRLFAIAVGITVLFIFLQSLTAGEFITEGLPNGAREVWTDVHGLLAYPIMVFALLAAIVAFARLNARGTAIMAGLLFVGAVVQWLLGHAITTLHMDWVTPFHVVLAFVIYGLAVWLSVRSAALRRR
ncbi:hypothetical protein [Curtobacterium sp. Leaf261]|uniref:hypothetical protein n=1 Tax=Curtobacterium sp. Leaf261 TaxID=1736311 RepID=UPI0006F46AAF|nr:hypothetical protein [Curtobacterium sp. Leaf261]KQO64904.1 hypothetical protein ASF23_01685 [Curtobacterium sp. Leaf261]